MDVRQEKIKLWAVKCHPDKINVTTNDVKQLTTFEVINLRLANDLNKWNTVIRGLRGESCLRCLMNKNSIFLKLAELAKSGYRKN